VEAYPYHLPMRIQGITIEVSDLAAAKRFYEDLLGFVPGDFYEPTRWQPYDLGGRYFAIREIGHAKHRDDLDITNFDVDDVEDLWARVKDSAEVAEELGTTPYGTYKFVIKDPDGYRLGFVGRKS
jgi:catechol 2,3-dioxygenase-like lactoylglutathione lyase family enzyme